MPFVFGVGALFTAFLVIVVFRRLLNRPGASWDPETWGASDAVSLTFTGLVAFGTISIVLAVVEGDFPAVAIELATALAVLVGACIGTWMLLGRSGTAAAVGTGVAPGSPSGPAPMRPGRTPLTPQPKTPAGSRKRAA